jgi:hypothetical protein
MNLRITLFLILALLAGNTAFAQDTIYTTQGAVIQARITSISTFAISYNTLEGGDSTSHRLRADYVLLVRYADGRTWMPRSTYDQKLLERQLALRKQRTNVRRSYANVITLNFPTYQDIGHYPGISVGLEYERFLDAKSRFSVSLSIERAWAGTNSRGKLSPGEVRANIQSWYFTPGAFYHPAENNKGFDLALGASFPLGSVKRDDTYYYPTPGSYKPPSTDMLAAALAEVNFSVHSPDHFVFTTSIAAGPLISAGETRGRWSFLAVSWGAVFESRGHLLAIKPNIMLLSGNRYFQNSL